MQFYSFIQSLLHHEKTYTLNQRSCQFISEGTGSDSGST
jgi:hypothetical protein